MKGINSDEEVNIYGDTDCVMVDVNKAIWERLTEIYERHEREDFVRKQRVVTMMMGSLMRYTSNVDVYYMFKCVFNHVDRYTRCMAELTIEAKRNKLPISQLTPQVLLFDGLDEEYHYIYTTDETMFDEHDSIEENQKLEFDIDDMIDGLNEVELEDLISKRDNSHINRYRDDDDRYDEYEYEQALNLMDEVYNEEIDLEREIDELNEKRYLSSSS